MKIYFTCDDNDIKLSAELKRMNMTEQILALNL